MVCGKALLACFGDAQLERRDPRRGLILHLAPQLLLEYSLGGIAISYALYALGLGLVRMAQYNVIHALWLGGDRL